MSAPSESSAHVRSRPASRCTWCEKSDPEMPMPTASATNGGLSNQSQS
jgi:hypothetical protein